MNVGPSVLQSPSERFCNCHLKRLWGFLDKADSLPVKLNRSLLLKLQRLFCAWRTSERQPSNYFDKSSEHTHSAWSPTRSVTPPKWQPPSEPVLLSAGLWADPSPEWSIPHLYGHLLCRVPRHHPSTQHYSQKQLQWWGWKRYSAHGLLISKQAPSDCTGLGQTKTAIWMDSRSPIFVFKAKRSTLLNDTLSVLRFKSNSNMWSSEVKAQHYIKWYI